MVELKKMRQGNAKKKRQCSRQLPKPLSLYLEREGNGGKNKLAYVVYPNLRRFKVACQKCRFRKVLNTNAGPRSQCQVKDKDFKLKYYGIAPNGGAKTLVGTVPPTIKNRYPKLYAEIVSYFEKHGARSFGRGVLQSGQKTRQGKPFLADGTDISLAGLKQPDRSEGIEESLKLESF